MTGIKVLLVDDEREFTGTLSKVLGRRGFVVDMAVDAASTLAALSRQEFDVVLLDIKMPGQDGIHVLTEIKSRTPSPEVILLTGHVSPTEESDYLRMGAFAYLLKPHPIDDIIVCLEAAAARSRDTREEGGESRRPQTAPLPDPRP